MDITDEYAPEPELMLAVVAHEVAHIVLGLRNIEIAEKGEDEELTDSVAIMGGFGPSYLRASYREKITIESAGVSGTSLRFGYLRPPAVAFLALVRARMCGIDLACDDQRFWIDRALTHLDHLCEQQAAPVSRFCAPTRLCIACSSPLGLLSSQKGLRRVRCPVCAFPQIVTVKN